MGFTVDAETLAGLPDLLDRLSDDASAAREYLVRNTRLHWVGIVSLIAHGHERAVAEADSFFSTVAGPIAHDDAGRVRAAVDYYRHTDAASAARVDATLPHPSAGARAVLTPGAHPGLFNDVTRPRDVLVPPPDHHGDFPYAPSWTQGLSPAAQIRNIIWMLTSLGAQLGICDRAYDPVAELVEPMSGDFAGLRGCADVFERLAGASAGMSSNVQWGAVCLDRVWTGSAADSCEDVLVRLDAALAEAQEPLRVVAEEYRRAAETVYEVNTLMGEVVNALIDRALIAFLALDGAAASSETVIGPVVLGAVAGYEISKVWDLFRHAMELVDLARVAMAALDTFLQGFSLFGNHPLPVLSTAAPSLPA